MTPSEKKEMIYSREFAELAASLQADNSSLIIECEVLRIELGKTARMLAEANQALSAMRRRAREANKCQPAR